MRTVSKDRPLLTTITGSLPRPHWFTANLQGRPFSVASRDAQRSGSASMRSAISHSTRWRWAGVVRRQLAKAAARFDSPPLNGAG